MGTSWRDLVPAADREVYEKAGFGRQQAIVGERPAVLVIDVTRGFVGSPGLSREEAVAEFRNSCGPAAWAAVPHIAKLLDAARERQLPIFYTKGTSVTDAAHLGRWVTKNSRAAEDVALGEDVHRIIDEVAPQPGDLVFAKEKPSAFFATPLVGHLISRGIDSLLVTGCTTSGCIRASVIDGFSYNFAVTIVEDGVFDRGELSHAVNLFDMQAKYAQVATSEQVIAELPDS